MSAPAPCRCSTAACRDCPWSGLSIDWPAHHADEPRHHYRAVTPFCGETPCATVAAQFAEVRKS